MRSSRHRAPTHHRRNRTTVGEPSTVGPRKALTLRGDMGTMRSTSGGAARKSEGQKAGARGSARGLWEVCREEGCLATMTSRFDKPSPEGGGAGHSRLGEESSRHDGCCCCRCAAATTVVALSPLSRPSATDASRQTVFLFGGSHIFSRAKFLRDKLWQMPVLGGRHPFKSPLGSWTRCRRPSDWWGRRMRRLRRAPRSKSRPTSPAPP